MSAPATDPRILRALEAATAKLEAEDRRRHEAIAIVGMACRFPGADTVDEFWTLLAEGREAVGPLPAARAAQGPARTPRPGGYLDNVDRFDAAFFGISPREAATLDPQQRLLLETTVHAFESAGWTRERLRGSRTAVFVGITNSDYARLLPRAHAGLDNYYVTGNTLNAAAGRIAYLFGLRGPAIAVDTACSSSLAALHLACQHLRSRESEAAIAAGVNLVLSDEGTVSLAEAGVLSTDGRCRTFDAAAGGMGRGEGCGVLLLKRLSDAERDGDEVVALIRGSAVNQDGASGGLTVPNGPAQEDVIRQALAASRLRPADVDYVEAHGTGTPLGDPIELGALARVFGPQRPAGRPLIVGAVKANVAHGESSAGMAGVIKTALCLQRGAIPPLAHFSTPSPHVDWTAPIEVPRALRPWPRGDRPRVAGISGFGFSGTNAHVILSEAPARAAVPEPQADVAPVVLPFSGQSARAADALASNYATWMKTTAVDIEDVSRAAFTTRDHLTHRMAVVAGSADEAARALEALVAGLESADALRSVVTHGAGAPVTFMFSGQGTQAAGMGAALRRAFPAFARALDECREILGHDPLAADGAAVDDTAFAQPALVAYEYALATLWQSFGVTPGAVLGHSVGEFAAACVAGVFGLEDALRLVSERGRLMSALPRDGAMIAVLAAPEIVMAAVAPHATHVSIAAMNAPENTVISGRRDAVEAIAASLAATGLRCTPLVVSHAFHSPLMAPMVAEFRAALERVRFEAPRVPFFSALTGARAAHDVATPAYWAGHVLGTVNFVGALRAAHTHGSRCFLEIGPHHTLTALGRASFADEHTRWIPSQRREEDEPRQLQRAFAELYVAGAAVDWAARGRARRHVTLPAYPFQRERFWIDVRHPAPSTGPREHGAYRVEWIDQPAAPAMSPRRWLITADRAGLAGAVAQELRARGHVARVAEHTADPESETAVLHLASLHVTDDMPWDQARADGVGTALGVLQRGLRAGARTWFVTRGAQAAGGGCAVAHQAALWGLGRTAAVEQPGAWGGLIDLDPDTADAPATIVEAILGSEGEERALRRGKILAPRLVPLTPADTATPRLSAHRSFLVSGAFGALGRHAIDWLLSRGARKLVLCGRRTPAPELEAELHRSASVVGAEVRTLSADVERHDDARRIVDEASALGPLGGILHAAGVLDDALLPSQDGARLDHVLGGKVRGALHLDAVTRGLALDFFILYSSFSAIVGSPGQANYAAANAMLDAIAAARAARGDRALSIAWGAWAGGGMAADRERAMRSMGLDAWAPSEALATLDALALTTQGCVTAARFDAQRMRLAHPAARLAIFDALSPRERAGEHVASVAPPRSRDEAAVYLEQAVAGVLRLGNGHHIVRSVSLQEQGLDSMMATELRNRVLRDLRIDLPIARFLAGATLHDVADALAREVTLALVVGPAGDDEGEEVVL